MRTALVTGGSRGIGRAIAARLAKDGFAVAINYRSHMDEAQTAVEEIRAAGGRGMAVQADIKERDQVFRMVSAVNAELGSIDVLINNAGVMIRGDVDDFDFSEMNDMRGTNVDGLVMVTRAVLPGMKTARNGRIVNLTSIAAHGTAMPGTTFYAATKAAVSILTRRFAMDLGPHGITVNAIAPGFILTDMVASGRTAEEAEQLRSSISGKTMVCRLGKPEDIAHAAAFLVSEEASFITGQILTVDGGRMDYISHP
jgi:NAD(P)-dependent dehydrogenase (short-subunit alcohol dehydrogenase family)